MKDIEKNDFQKVHRTEWHNFLWKKFLDKFSNRESNDAINSIFSDYEKRLITKRLAALALIRDGVGTREISRRLWLSSATISALRKTFFSNAKHYKSPRSFKKLSKNADESSLKITNNHWIKDLFNDINLWELIKNPPRPKGIGIKR